MLVTTLFHRILLQLIYNDISLFFKNPAVLNFKIIFKALLVAGVSFVDDLYCFDLLFGCWYRFGNILIPPHNTICICRTAPDLTSFICIFSLISLFWIDLKCQA